MIYLLIVSLKIVQLHPNDAGSMFAIMDNNENENYCYPQPGTAASKGAIPKATAFKYQNQFNNNVAEQENLMPQVNGAQTSFGCCEERLDCVQTGAAKSEVLPVAASNELDTDNDDSHRVNGKAESFIEELPFAAHNENHVAQAAIDSEEGDLDGDYSDNNSLGNLSYISENGLIEEIILLPNNIYSDEENVSASDDCIYAYRGDDQAPALLEYRDQPADDETDFLEMDFDPEPSSELENLLEHQEISIDPYLHSRAVERSPEVKSIPITKSPSFETDPLVRQHEEPPETETGAAAVSLKESVEVKKTGAIPKKLPASVQQSMVDCEQPGPSRSSWRGNSKNLKLDLKLCTDDDAIGYHHNYPYFYNPRNFATDDDEENNCLDCTANQFLMQTKQDLSVQKVCRSCYSRSTNQGCQPLASDHFNYFGQSLNSSNSETDLMSIRAEQIVLQALNKINELKATPPSLGLSKSMEELCVELDSTQQDQEVPVDFDSDICSEKTVTIYTLNCGELTIIEALTRIGVAPNLEVLRQYFTEQYTVDTCKMNIPQYILHMSKRDCNFKKLIEAIKSCCEDTLDIQYYPLDPFSDIPEIVQINSVEIAKRWNANTNLRQIINIKHKHFHTLNVLGKIVNIVRQPSRGRYINQMINIPQYYKSGSITITRVN